MFKRVLVSSAVAILALTVVSCGRQKRKQCIAELRRLLSAVEDVNLVTSAGVTQEEFSRRYTDALLKMGNLSESLRQNLDKFPKKDQEALKEAYRHLGQAMDAYQISKNYFGDNHKNDPDFDPFQAKYMLSETEYEAARAAFPGLEELTVAIAYEEHGGRRYWRGDMLQALWKVAMEESQRAKLVIERLAQE